MAVLGSSKIISFLVVTLFGVCMNISINSIPATSTDTIFNIFNKGWNIKNEVTQGFLSFLGDTYEFPEASIKNEYDFIIIGAGSAGSVVANRLSENGKYQVLVLEAGGPESILTDIPLVVDYFITDDKYRWRYLTQPLEGVCMAMVDKRCHWPRGKAIGGTSVINFMLYTRGFKEDWDRIASYGNPGWSWDDVLPYFLKSEGANNLNGLENTEYHNRDGPLSVSYTPYKSELTDAFLEAGRILGYDTVDYNANQKGFARAQTTTIYGHRCSAAKAFLHKIKNRENLNIIPHATVTKIIINPEKKIADAVKFVRKGVEHVVWARKEIILSAGPVASPQLLMLSGIGPEDHLKSLDIEVIENLPVGQNIYDHISFPGLPFVVNATGVSLIESRTAADISQLTRWIQYGDGVFSSNSGAEALAWIKTDAPDEIYGNEPNIELILLTTSLAGDQSQFSRKGMNINGKFFTTVFSELQGKDTFTIVPMNLHPKSKGYLRLPNKNPYRYPLIYYDYFSQTEDLKSQVEAIKFIIRLAETEPFQKMGARMNTNHFPTCKSHIFGTDDYWGCAVRSVSATLHHQMGSCKMGPAEDPEAIVNHELKVHGVHRLRVIDSSIIPKPIAAHTNAPAIMIGEKGADMILSQYN